MDQTINAVYLKVTCAGSAGSATGTATTAVSGGIRGFLYSVYAKPTASGWAATTDITVTESGAGTASRNILTLTDKSNAAASYPVRVAEVGSTGAATGGYTPVALGGGQITVSLTQANDAQVFEVWLYILR
jgi:hypothetical protein